MSMGWGAARKLRQSVANLGRIVACELVCAGRGLEFRQPAGARRRDRGGAGRPAGRRRGRAPGPTAGWPPTWPPPRSWSISGGLVAAVEAVTGPLD